MTASEVPHADPLDVLGQRVPSRDEIDAITYALGDTVPREQYDRDVSRRERWDSLPLDVVQRIEQIESERDEARAERDARDHVIEQVRRWEQEYADHGADMHDLRAVTETAPAVSLALHDAEVWWRGVTAQWEHRPVGNRLLESRNPYRAAALREGADQ